MRLHLSYEKQKAEFMTAWEFYVGYDEYGSKSVVLHMSYEKALTKTDELLRTLQACSQTNFALDELFRGMNGE